MFTRLVCEKMLSDYQEKLKCMITRDETWTYAYDPETTDQPNKYRVKARSEQIEFAQGVQKSRS